MLAAAVNPVQLRYEMLGDEMKGLRPFLEDATVNEIMLNADGRVWVERNGQGNLLTDVTMSSAQAEVILHTVAALMDCQIGPQRPSVQGHLEGGLRIQGLLPPIVDRPIFALRKPSPVVFSLDDLERQGVLPSRLDSDLADLTGSAFARRWKKLAVDPGLSLLERVRLAIHHRANFVIGGPTSSGKTQLGKAIFLELAATTQRLLVIQDTLEIPDLAPNQVNIRAMSGWVFTPREAVLAAMRLAPKRIIVGELRDGPTALELLKAWGTGHPGGLTTLHGDHPVGLLNRFAQLVEEVVYPAPRELIAEAVNVLLYISPDDRLPAGRSITAAALVEGFDQRERSWRLSPL